MTARARIAAACLALLLAPSARAQVAPPAAAPGSAPHATAATGGAQPASAAPSAADAAAAALASAASTAEADAMRAANAAGLPAPAVEANADELAAAIASEADGRWDEAHASYDRLALAAPDDLRIVLGLARVHTAQGRAWEAATLLEGASAAHPDCVRLLRATGDAILAAGSTTMALETYDHALALAPGDAGVRCAAAWAALAGHRADRLMGLLEPVPLASMPAPLQRALGRAALLAGKADVAVAALEAFLQGAAGNPAATASAEVAATVDALLDLARAHLLLAQDGPALETLRLALAQQPDCAAAYVLLGHLRLRGSQRDLALASYEEAIRRGADAAPLAPLLARLRPRSTREMPRPDGNGSTAGVSLIEVMLVIVVIGIGAGMAVPRFGVATEQTQVDQAASALRSVWVAERLWWLERHEFCDSLDDLVAERFVDQPLLDQVAPFTLSLPAGDAEGFTARMARSGSDEWAGELLIDETGVVTGYIANGAGLHVLPQTP